MSSLEKRYEEIMKVWKEIETILIKNNLSMGNYNGSIAIFNQNTINSDLIVMPDENRNEINYNYDDTPF